MDKIKILNIDFLNTRMDELVRILDKGMVITPNVDIIMTLQKDRSLLSICRKAEYIVCDSNVIRSCSRFLGTPFLETIPGSDLFPAYCRYHAQQEDSDVKVFLLGSQGNIAQVAMEKMNVDLPRSIIVGAYSPSYGFEKNIEECEQIVEMVNYSGANVLAMGVGTPKQEKWADHYKCRLNTKLIFNVGATIDFIAECVPRAPKIFKKIGIEWLFRLVMEPKRLWKRYLIRDIPFFYLVILQKFRLYKEPFVLIGEEGREK